MLKVRVSECVKMCKCRYSSTINSSYNKPQTAPDVRITLSKVAANCSYETIQCTYRLFHGITRQVTCTVDVL